MAKLGSYYGLCPLIDQKSLLGISEDATPGHVIVTLGKNMAIKYKLSDQKQIHSWSTKEKLSSPVIYDKKADRYAAIFNQQFIRVWTENDKNLDKIKKIKFHVPIHTILYSEDEPIIIFKNGQTHTLSYALENRVNISQKEIIQKSKTIEDSTCVKINEKYFIGLLLKENYKFMYLLLQLDNEVTNNKIKRIDLNRSNLKLNGHVIMNTENCPVLFTLWSDGRLHYYPLNDENAVAPGEFFSVVENLSRELKVSMIALNDTYIAMYGADNDQEGAILQIYNIRFKITQSRQHFKLFTEGSKIWSMNNTLLLTVGENLAVIPFVLDTEQLAALVGSHKLTVSADQDVSIVTEMVVGDWGMKHVKQSEIKMPEKVKGTLTELLKEGWSECAICEEIFPKLMENNDSKTILECLDYFVDISEKIIAKLLLHCLQNMKAHTDIIKEGFANQTSKYLDKLLTLSYSDVLIMPHLRSELKFDVVLIILQYLCFLLSPSGHILCDLTVTQSERKIIDWGSMLLDTYYQNLLLSKDPTILENQDLHRC